MLEYHRGLFVFFSFLQNNWTIIKIFRTIFSLLYFIYLFYYTGIYIFFNIFIIIIIFLLLFIFIHNGIYILYTYIHIPVYIYTLSSLISPPKILGGTYYGISGEMSWRSEFLIFLYEIWTRIFWDQFERVPKNDNWCKKKLANCTLSWNFFVL